MYDGQWFSPLRKALSAFVTSTQEHVTGKVRLELYKGNLINAGVWSPYSLYREDIATFAAVSDQYLFWFGHISPFSDISVQTLHGIDISM